MDWVAIGARIRSQREQFGYTREAFAEMLKEDVDLKVEPFLTEEEAVDIFGKVLNMEGLNFILPIVAKAE